MWHYYDICLLISVLYNCTFVYQKGFFFQNSKWKKSHLTVSSSIEPIGTISPPDSYFIKKIQSNKKVSTLVEYVYSKSYFR